MKLEMMQELQKKVLEGHHNSNGRYTASQTVINNKTPPSIYSDPFKKSSDLPNFQVNPQGTKNTKNILFGTLEESACRPKEESPCVTNVAPTTSYTEGTDLGLSWSLMTQNCTTPLSPTIRGMVAPHSERKCILRESTCLTMSTLRWF